jgi:site-specific DNA-methyltransferase (adenine-specific)
LSRIETIADGIDLWLGDCRDIMPLLGRVSAVITDPPYEQISQDRIGGIKRNDRGKVTEKITFVGIDGIRDQFTALVPTVCDGWFLAFCTAEGVALWRDAIERHSIKYKSPMIWVKPDAMPKFNGQGPALGYENIVAAWCGKGHSSWNGGGKRGVFTWPTNSPDREGTHPTEKPVGLMSELLSLFTRPAETVLDPFMGSGTTGVAAVRHGRRFIGIEANEQYYDVAVRRISKALKQPDLFIEAPKPVKQEAFEL